MEGSDRPTKEQPTADGIKTISPNGRDGEHVGEKGRENTPEERGTMVRVSRKKGGEGRQGERRREMSGREGVTRLGIGRRRAERLQTNKRGMGGRGRPKEAVKMSRGEGGARAKYEVEGGRGASAGRMMSDGEKHEGSGMS